MRLQLLDSRHSETFEGVTSFVGEDASGSFSLWPHHTEFITSLEFGLARFRVAAAPWQYVAVPGATLHLAKDQIMVATRRFFRADDYDEVRAVLEKEMAAEEVATRLLRASLRQLEEGILTRLSLVRRGAR